MLDCQETIARFLGVNKEIISVLEKNLNKATGRFGVLKTLLDRNENLVSGVLKKLGLLRNCSRADFERALLSKAEIHDAQIARLLDNPDLKKPEQIERVLSLVREISDHQTGFFLKEIKARELMLREPPLKILKVLDYNSVDEMLTREDWLEVYSGLRFVEDSEWLNNVFFKQYETLIPEDFEERPIITRALNSKWIPATENFVNKKLHNVSHLKELGVIFVIPVSFGVRGEMMRLFGLLSHYFHEIYFYSDLFKFYAAKENFAASLISLLRGDVLDNASEEPNRYLIIQRYLAKINPQDPRLFVPHVNPEALHYTRAESSIINLGKINPDLKSSLDFWNDLGWAGGIFRHEVSGEGLVALNMMDTVMSLVKGGVMMPYLYHHQEALWNQIFIEFLGEAKVREIIRENIIGGWFSI